MPQWLQRAGSTGSGALRFARARAFGGKVPLSVSLSLTHRCNFRCIYCDLPGRHRDELDADRWCAVIDEFHRAGMIRASLIGGEPLLRRDAGRLIDHLRRRGVHSAMNTNGWHLRDRLDEVAALDLVSITLDGPPEIHDRQRRAGSHERVIEAIDALRRRGVPVVTMTVLTSEATAPIDHALEVATAHGIRAFFQVAHDGAFDVMGPIGAGPGGHGARALARRLLALKDTGRPVGNSRAVLRAQIRDGLRLGGSCQGCAAGRFMAFVLPDGTVAPCLLTRRQVPRENGLQRGFLRAFHELKAPVGPGCACVPLHEVNRLLSLRPSALFDALELVAAGWRPRLGRG